MGWSPFTRRSFHVLNLFLPVKRSHTGSLTSSSWTCQPSAVYGRDITKLTSSFVPCVMSSSLSSDSGHDEVTALTYRLTSSSMSLQSDFCRGLLDRAYTTSMPFAMWYVTSVLKRISWIFTGVHFYFAKTHSVDSHDSLHCTCTSSAWQAVCDITEDRF